MLRQMEAGGGRAGSVCWSGRGKVLLCSTARVEKGSEQSSLKLPYYHVFSRHLNT